MFLLYLKYNFFRYSFIKIGTIFLSLVLLTNTLHAQKNTNNKAIFFITNNTVVVGFENFTNTTKIEEAPIVTGTFFFNNDISTTLERKNIIYNTKDENYFESGTLSKTIIASSLPEKIVQNEEDSVITDHCFVFNCDHPFDVKRTIQKLWALIIPQYKTPKIFWLSINVKTSTVFETSKQCLNNFIDFVLLNDKLHLSRRQTRPPPDFV